MKQVWVEICTSHLKTDHNRSLKEECWNGWVLHIGVSPSFIALALGPRVGPAPYQGPLFSSSSLSKSLLESSIDRHILIEHVQNGELPSNETGCQDCEVAGCSMPLCQPDFLQLPANFLSWTSFISSQDTFLGPHLLQIFPLAAICQGLVCHKKICRQLMEPSA